MFPKIPEMTLASVIPCCLVSACVGYLIAILVRSGRRRENSTHQTLVVPDQESPESAKYVETLVHSIYELTSQVDLQVGQHSLRVSEITDSLECPGEIGSALVLAAGRMLINANQQLQTDLEEAKSEIQRQREQLNSCMLESRTDALTGIPNRRAFDLEMNRVFSHHRRDGSTFSLLIIDIDYFKRFNDLYGHMVGDQLLRCFARCLSGTLREYDFLARFGGEEFVVILPQTPLKDAIGTAERVRRVIANNRYKVGDLELRLTVSIGIKEVEDGEIDSELMQRADEALYAAKNGGRNRCCYHDGIALQCFSRELADETVDRGSPSESVPAPVVALASASTFSR